MRKWTEIDPADAREINLHEEDDIQGPLNEEGQECPWPWEPQQLKGVPMGQFHCPYCGAMVLAGFPHLDYADLQEITAEDLLPKDPLFDPSEELFSEDDPFSKGT